MTGAELTAEERKRQIEEEHFDENHDDEYYGCELAIAGATYALDYANLGHHLWPWDDDDWKPRHDKPIRQLVKAGGCSYRCGDRPATKTRCKPCIRCPLIFQSRGISGDVG